MKLNHLGDGRVVALLALEALHLALGVDLGHAHALLVLQLLGGQVVLCPQVRAVLFLHLSIVNSYY